MRHLVKKRLALFVILGCITTAFGSWGFLVHKTVNQTAIYQLKGDLREFFFKNKEYLVQHAPRPDIRRNTDSTEHPKHFIDLEPFGDSSAWKMPFSWDEAVKTYTKDSLLKYGFVPYVIHDLTKKLTEAFRQKNKDSILFYATDLGHYISDANVPLHTSINYDGQLTGQDGLHSLWESFIPDIELNNYNLRGNRKARYLKDTDAAIWEAIRRAHLLLPAILNKEKEVSKNFTEAAKFKTENRRGKQVKRFTREFAMAYANSLKPTINEQLIHSANLIADFWYTAWVNAGKPDMEDINNGFSKADKKQMKKEIKSYRSNSLISDSVLLARRPQKSSGISE